MTIAFCTRPFGLATTPGSDTDFAQVGELLAQPNGLYAVRWAPTAGGIAPVNPLTLLGVSPQGTYSTGALDFVGNGQQFALVDNNKLVIRPNWFNGSALLPGQPTRAYVIGCVVFA
jgi:hypothetical protein